MANSNIAAFSGGKDSTAMVLRLAETGEDFSLFFTPTGNEMPQLLEHIARVATIVQRPLVVRAAELSLAGMIRAKNALPNNRQRWCTRSLKIEPCKAYLLQNPGSTLIVGLRADEEERAGMWGEHATYRYPLREWGWGIETVWSYLNQRQIQVPARTDCAWCYDQRLSEWWALWKNYPDLWAQAEELEALTGHTFRSPTRDTWPAALRDLRAEFERGRLPRGLRSLPLFSEIVEVQNRCRVCSM